jgi:murein tripeptide amidase MpaA
MSPFRDNYLRYEELTRIVHEWARTNPAFVRVKSIGKSVEGRDLWLLEIGRDPDRARAAAWVDGNMHASELCGSSVALAIAEDVLRLHLSPDGAASTSASSAVTAARLRGVRFYVLPRMSPDGAEVVLDNGRYVRSVPRDLRPAQGQHRPPEGPGAAVGVGYSGRIVDLVHWGVAATPANAAHCMNLATEDGGCERAARRRQRI